MTESPRGGNFGSSALLRQIAICVGLLMSVQAARGDGSGGTAAADFLRLEIGAASTAQGGAFAGRSGGVEVFAYNPAGLARAERHEITFQHTSALLDIRQEYLAGVMRMSRWTAAGSLSYHAGGEQIRRTISNPSGAGLPGFHNDALAVSLGLATAFGDAFSVGGTVKIFKEQLDTAKRNGFALDLGLHYLFANGAYEAGAVIRNIGPQVKFDRAGEDLPLELALGASARFLNDRLRLSGELDMARAQDIRGKAGIEYRVIDFLVLRAGYNSRIELGSGVSAGLGIPIGNLLFDYAWVDHGLAGDAHRAALTVGF